MRSNLVELRPASFGQDLRIHPILITTSIDIHLAQFSVKRMLRSVLPLA